MLLVLAACKFLDLLLVIQSEDFQMYVFFLAMSSKYADGYICRHQWMFVTDTTDAAYPPEEYAPDAMMDKLAELLSELGSKGGDTVCFPYPVRGLFFQTELIVLEH